MEEYVNWDDIGGDIERPTILKDVLTIFSEDDIDENGIYHVPDNYDKIAPLAFLRLKNPKVKGIALGSKISEIPDIIMRKLPEGCKVFDLSETTIKEIPSVTSPEFNSELERIILPKTLSVIGECAFKNIIELKSVEFAEGTNLELIGDEAFQNCALRRIDIPETEKILRINTRAFSSCTDLQEVHLPKNVVIGALAFDECSNLREIEIPPCSGEVLGAGAFHNCRSLRKAVIGDGYYQISNNMFDGCSSLSEVVLPDTLEEICSNAFLGDSSLRSIDLPKKLIIIGHDAFNDCELEKLDLPDGLQSIGESAFANNKGLKEVIIPKSVQEVKRDCFKYCTSLERIVYPENMSFLSYLGGGLINLREVVLPKKLEEIQGRCFEYIPLEKAEFPETLSHIGRGALAHSKIKEFIMPEGKLYEIGDEAFMDCRRLEKVVLPKGLNTIRYNAFRGCVNLKEIVLPDGIFEIYDDAFSSCSSLEEIKIGSGRTILHPALFQDCQNLKSITIERATFTSSTFEGIPKGLQQIKIGKYCVYDDCELIEGMDYLTYKDGYFYFTKEPINQDSIDLQKFCNGKEILMSAVMALWDERTQLQKLLAEDSMIADLINMVYLEQGDDGLRTFFAENKNNLKFFKQIKLDAPQEDRQAFCKFYYNLGGFVTHYQETRKDKHGKESVVDINYAQKVGEFLKEMIKEYPSFFRNSSDYFSGMELYGMKKDFTDFMLDKKNFGEIVEENKNYDEFLSIFYNEFENAQKLNTSNRGRQRQLKPTLKIAKLYVLGNTFSGVKEENMQLAMILRQYFTQQTTLENAIKIQEEKIAGGVGDHILKEPLIEKIDETAQKIAETASDTLSEMSEIASNRFTFEMLSKSDPINFVLGKLCTCCAHLEGVGYGIMRASIVSPEVQNIVIRNADGVIVAKSTLYVNTKEGYGVCNNFEVNDNVDEEDLVVIKEKFMEAIRQFAIQYNKDYPERKKLTQINVGTGNNDLNGLFEEDEVIGDEDKLLRSIQYSDFGDGWNNYNGDSSDFQIKAWELDEDENEIV